MADHFLLSIHAEVLEKKFTYKKLPPPPPPDPAKKKKRKEKEKRANSSNPKNEIK